MNWDTIEGKWKQAKGSFREKWGDLTDNELEETAGKKDRLVGLLQEKYGMARDRAENALDSWAGRHEEGSLDSVWNDVSGRWTELVGNFKEQYGKATDDELAESRGKRDTLAGMIQREYNVSRGEAFEIVDDWAYGNYPSKTEVK